MAQGLSVGRGHRRAPDRGQNVNSDYWVLENVPATGFAEPSGDACDSWDRWRDDIAAIRAMGLNTYRFSVEWARVEPEPGQFSLAALDHYRRICAACREAGITPMVTFHHFTSPRWVAGRGGWEAPETAELFARYCERTAKAIGDLLDWACTVNEPNGQVSSYIVAGRKPFAREAEIRAQAAKAVGSDRFCGYFQGDSLKVRDVCIEGHRRGVQAIKAANPKIKVGMTLALQDLVPGPGGERLYRELFDNARAPFYAAANGDDFIGVQPYMRPRHHRDGLRQDAARPLGQPPGHRRAARCAARGREGGAQALPRSHRHHRKRRRYAGRRHAHPPPARLGRGHARGDGAGHPGCWATSTGA